MPKREASATRVVRSAPMAFNPEHFRRRYPGRPFPDIRFRPAHERWAAGRRLARRFGHSPDGSDASPVWELFDLAVPLDTAGPASDRFDLVRLFDEYDLAPRPAVYLDWYSDEQAEVELSDLAGRFHAFWEPGEDDLALFDDSCEWVLYFTRGGDVRLARAEPDEA